MVLLRPQPPKLISWDGNTFEKCVPQPPPRKTRKPPSVRGAQRYLNQPLEANLGGDSVGRWGRWKISSWGPDSPQVPSTRSQTSPPCSLIQPPILDPYNQKNTLIFGSIYIFHQRPRPITIFFDWQSEPTIFSLNELSCIKWTNIECRIKLLGFQTYSLCSLFFGLSFLSTDHPLFMYFVRSCTLW
jgi:hypothetical protein